MTETKLVFFGVSSFVGSRAMACLIREKGVSDIMRMLAHACFQPHPKDAVS